MSTKMATPRVTGTKSQRIEPLTKRKAWKALQPHYAMVRKLHLRNLFADDATRGERMTVNPGFGHQHFIHTTLPKIRRVRGMIDESKRGCDLEVDGGINATTVPLVVDAGANVLVAGTAIFDESGAVASAMDRLRASITQPGK